jgi:hypothetical protein
MQLELLRAGVVHLGNTWRAETRPIVVRANDAKDLSRRLVASIFQLHLSASPTVLFAFSEEQIKDSSLATTRPVILFLQWFTLAA